MVRDIVPEHDFHVPDHDYSESMVRDIDIMLMDSVSLNMILCP